MVLGQMRFDGLAVLGRQVPAYRAQNHGIWPIAAASPRFTAESFAA